MPKFEEHLAKSKDNLQFLENICKNESAYWDWKVTVCFYTALHLINAHIANKTGQHYRSHEEVENAINFDNQLSLCALSQNDYLAYKKLNALSRRSRYLVNENLHDKRTSAFFTYDKHFKRAVKYLNTLMEYFNNEYQPDFKKIEIKCIELNNTDLKYFKVIV
ncbi:MAG: hypothetical protein GVY19_10245 [Bacteroidetes bacterium]|jgi:hypothetical protein|nr:hypothetical protein [Bacteroidota bacterium]